MWNGLPNYVVGADTINTLIIIKAATSIKLLDTGSERKMEDCNPFLLFPLIHM